MNCNVKYKCDFLVHHVGVQVAQCRALQVIRSVDQGSSPGKGHLCCCLLCIVMSNTSATFLVHHSGRPGGAPQSDAGYQICRPGFDSRPPIYVVSSCALWSNTSATSLQVFNRNLMWIVRSSITSDHCLTWRLGGAAVRELANTL